LELVMILAEDQLEGKVELNRTGGTKYVIRIRRQT
jgi:two-component sensor histidine kinase